MSDVYGQLTQMIERLHRRMLDVIRFELEQAGVSDINPAQALMLTKIEGREVALRDIIERGYYIGSNASYNIKQLVEADYVVQKRSAHDKRSVKVSLTEKGEELCKRLVEFNAAQAERLAGTKEATAQLSETIEVLRNLENSWSEYLRYGSV
ncbi:MAG: DNA-binding MarR family transcriptional regulator [Paracoccaceae bacterium]|jgi:DNA-binding MarR family transcriptional regulator